MKITREQLKETLRTIMREEAEYQQFFKKALEKSGKSIPDMSDEEKKDFFNKIDAAWDGKGEKKNEGNAFGAAVTAAKEKGEDSFEVGGKEYKVESVNESLIAKDGKILLNGKPVGYYDYDRDSSAFWTTDLSDKQFRGSKAFDTKEEMLAFFKKYLSRAAKAVEYEKKSLAKFGIKYPNESVNEAANSKGYKPKNDFGARIIQAIDTNIKECNPKYLKMDGVAADKILEYGKSFLEVARNGIKAAFKFNYKIHPDVEFPMRNPKGNYFWFNSREDMENYLKKFLSDLKKLDAMIVNYQKKPTLKAQQEICNFWNWEIMVGSKQTGGMGPGIATSDRSGQSMYESSINEEKYTVIDPRGNSLGTGLQIQAASMAKKQGGEKAGYFVVPAKNALKARRALEKFKGDFKNPKLKDLMSDLFYENKSVNEGRAFINAAKKAKAEGKTEFEFNGKKYPVTIKD